jgi:hypothetical protein
MYVRTIPHFRSLDPSLFKAEILGGRTITMPKDIPTTATAVPSGIAGRLLMRLGAFLFLTAAGTVLLALPYA